MNLYRFLEPGEHLAEGDLNVALGEPNMEPIPDYLFGETVSTDDAMTYPRLVITLPDGVEPAEWDDDRGGWVRLTTDEWPGSAQWVRRDRIPAIIAALLAAWQTGAS